MDNYLKYIIDLLSDLNLTNAIPPILASLIILLLDLLKSQLTKRKGDIWIKFLQSDKYINECIQNYKKIKSPKIIEQVKSEVMGMFACLCLYFGITSFLLIKFEFNWYSFALSIVFIFLISFMYLIIMYRIIDKHKKNQQPLTYSERIARLFIFVNWFIIMGALIVLFVNPYTLYKAYPSDLDINISGFSFILFLLSIWLSFIKNREFLDEVKDLLNKKYFKQFFETFPKISIKTKSVELDGTICDIFDDNLIVLNNYGIKKAIEWDSITSMELKIYTKI